MATKKACILFAEDDPNLGLLLTDYLESEGFAVKLCKDGVAALQAFQKQEFSLCLFDVMMPKLDGYSLAEKVRELHETVPIIFLTAKSLKDDKLKGYKMGADDYVVKPFDEEELLWKIRAALRRSSSAEKDKPIEPIALGTYIFEPANQLLICHGNSKRMTEKESEILAYLAMRPNQVIRRETMLRDLWGENDYFMGRSLDVFISKIRKYLKDDPTVTIESVFGVGFVFNLKN